MLSPAYLQICAWENLLLAWRKASRGKRGSAAVAQFEFGLADELLALREALLAQRYRPGGYRHFPIREPKRRLISAAPFRDRVVHHALCNVIEPRFEGRFVPDSYANRPGKGTHRAVDRVQQLARQYRYVLRADVVQLFPSIYHAILRPMLARQMPEADVMALADTILASGEGVFEGEYRKVWFPGDDLLAACRPRGLPIGNLTSQLWANVYLHDLDQFVTRELGCLAYARYVDDLALFADSKRALWAWKQAIIERLARLRLVIHEPSAQVEPTRCGVAWLSFVVYPAHRRVKARNVVAASRRLAQRIEDCHAGRISHAELNASIKGWVNHSRYADSRGLRRHVLGGLAKRPKP